jgi:hypothetical protein
MLAQFQDRYPTGSLISELLQIYQGKFVVRVSATVEGVTRATGMAAAETLELAEDRARSRALAVLGIQPRPSTQEEDAPKMFFRADSSPESGLKKRALSGAGGDGGDGGDGERGRGATLSPRLPLPKSSPHLPLSPSPLPPLLSVLYNSMQIGMKQGWVRVNR